MALKIRQHVIKTKSIAGTPVACHCCDAGCSKAVVKRGRKKGIERERRRHSTKSKPHMKQDMSKQERVNKCRGKKSKKERIRSSNVSKRNRVKEQAKVVVG